MLINRESADIVFTDQVSAVNVAVRLLRLARRKLVFYCHYPDVLLCTDRVGLVKRIYRYPFDALERYTTSVCDVLLVNSEFTAETLRKTFPNVRKKVHVLYPPIDTKPRSGKKTELPPSITGKLFVSLNRYERKKDLGLVIEAFSDFVKIWPNTEVQLVMAGGYDPRLPENVEYFVELQKMVLDKKLDKKVVMLKNVSDGVREALLADAEAVVYTPQFEHFGIVPCEAMQVGTPVIAWNNGGPKESVIPDKTGWLCSERGEFGKALVKALGRKGADQGKMSKACKDRVAQKFSLTAFTTELVNLIK